VGSFGIKSTKVLVKKEQDPMTRRVEGIRMDEEIRTSHVLKR